MLPAMLEDFLQPLYQDVDGVSRFPDAQRVARIARAIHTPRSEEELRHFELLLLFHPLGKWLEKVGNVSRVTLTFPDVSEADLRGVAQSIRRLEGPVTPAESAVAAAILIDNSGVRGLGQRFAAARRGGQSITDVVREAVADAWIPEWVPEAAREWLGRRYESRRRFCAAVLEELALGDQVRTTPARV